MTVPASARRFWVLSLAVLAVGCSGASGTTGSSAGSTTAAGTTVTGAGTSSTTSGPGTTDGALTTSGAVTTTGATTGATSSSGTSSGSTSGASTSGSITTVGASTGATTGAATSSGSITTTGASTAGATTVAAATSGAGTTTSGGGTTSSSTTGGTTGSTPVACIPDGDWSGQTVTCNGTVASNYVPGTFELDVDAGYGTFIQTFPIGAGGCKFLAPGPISCFTDGGGTFTQVTFTQTGPSSCEPAGCGMNLSLCSANPGSPINWSLTGDSASGFTLTSVDPNALTTCTSDSLSNPIEITWSAQ